MQEYFFDVRTPSVNVFDFFRCNVLALLQLENVFLPVNDSQTTSFGHNHPHVTRLEPPVLGDGFFSFILQLIVPWNDGRASEPNLSARRRSSLFIFVFWSVFHLWNVSKSELEISLKFK
jgi:hypothetical protein